ncbi:hypothetical protein FOPE_09833 [Fonsecaea pedrosoi]|nr:hypothetical protein FOPE_09833 [Fonsecaea pedrosoi]
MESVPVAEFVHLDGTTVTDRVIGIGGTNIVIQRGKYAVKIPRLSRITLIGDITPSIDQSRTRHEGDYDYHADLIRALNTEKDIYRRIGPHVGVTPCYNVSSTHPSVRMPLMEQDLQHYLADNRPNRKRQLGWLRRLADTLAHIHSRRVIVADVRPTNIVLDSDSNVKFVDFSESTLMPLDWDLEGTDALGYSILSDIGQLGAVMFQIVTGQTCRFHLEDANGDVAWPPRDSLPSTDNVWLGTAIEKCWTQGFRSAGDLARYLKHVNEDDSNETDPTFDQCAAVEKKPVF